MLFDEKELNVFDNNESKTYFKEILQSYYSQNYRATIVLLYSFVIYDLFMKLQTMANEGDKKAIAKLREINTMIADDEKYSKVETAVISFFKYNCPLYFNRFIEDIEYLKKCRNKCAHLKVNDNSLFVPSDYHSRMLICSMYDNVLSVKAPFIMDLFSIVQPDIEKYSTKLFCENGVDDAIIMAISNQYLSRMTYDSIKRSYKTFVKLLFVSDNEDTEKKALGLYAFTYSMTDYIVRSGYVQIFNEPDILDIFGRITVDVLKKSDSRRNLLISIMLKYPLVMDVIQSDAALFDYLCECVLLKPYGLKKYRVFYPRAEKTAYAFFMENSPLWRPAYTSTLYEAIKDCDDFNLHEFLIKLVSAIPTYNGFSDADAFTSFFIKHLDAVEMGTIEDVLKIYRGNSQCCLRRHHDTDIAVINQYIQDHQAKDTPEE
jgi:hypothetical protein